MAYDSSSGYTFFTEMARFFKQTSAHTKTTSAGTFALTGTSLDKREAGSSITGATFKPISAHTIVTDDENGQISFGQIHNTSRYVSPDSGETRNSETDSMVPISYWEYYYYNGTSGLTYQSYVTDATYKDHVSITNNTLNVGGFDDSGKAEVQYYEFVLKPFKLDGVEVNRQYDYMTDPVFNYSAVTTNQNTPPDNLLTQITFKTARLPESIFYPKRPRLSLQAINEKNGQYGFFIPFQNGTRMAGFASPLGDNNISLMPYVNDGKTIDSANFFSGETDNYYSKRYIWYYDKDYPDKYVSLAFSDLFRFNEDGGYEFDLDRHLGANQESPTVKEFVNSYKIQGPSSRCWYWSHGEPYIKQQISYDEAADIPLRSIREMYFSGIVLNHPKNICLTCSFSGWTGSTEQQQPDDEFTYLLNFDDEYTIIRPTKEYAKIQIGLGTAYAYHCSWDISGLTGNGYETIHNQKNNIIRELELRQGDNKTIKLRPRIRLEKHSFSASGVSPITLIRENGSFRVKRDGEDIGWYGGIIQTEGTFLFNIPLLKDGDIIEDTITYSNNNGKTWTADAENSHKNLECFERRRYTTFINAIDNEEVYAAKMIGWDKPKDSDGWTTVTFEANKYVMGSTTFCFQGTTTDVLFPPLWIFVNVDNNPNN